MNGKRQAVDTGRGGADSMADTNRQALVQELRTICRGKLLLDEPLAQHTTFGVGGPADLFFYPADPEDLARALPVVRDAGIPILPLGGGTNVLVKDSGFRGLVVCLTEGVASVRLDGSRVVTGAGAQIQVVSRRCQREGRTGLEFACGIPGTVGGAVCGNAGAWGGETFDRLTEVTCLDLQTAIPSTLRKADIPHGYRHADLGRDLVVLEAAFEMDEEDPAAIRGRMDRMLADRKATQPLWMRNAGCVFKNPMESASPESGRVSAGSLIDRAGCKGRSVGNVEVSRVHGNFMVTKGGTSAAEVLQLIEEVREQVRRREGVELETEVRIVGERGLEGL